MSSIRRRTMKGILLPDDDDDDDCRALRETETETE
jgi:hypothetical protein